MGSNRGFTLIEILVVIAVLAVLAGGLLVGLKPATQYKKSRDGRRKADLEQIRGALEMCYADTGSYPGSVYDSIVCSDQTYLDNTPKDPSTDANYSYSPSTSTYDLCATLEFDQDPDYPNYCVANP